jgi:Asp-tRNA(Asn)/Glu-tRNA(Gln) amidotransferase A subunit family amidase
MSKEDICFMSASDMVKKIKNQEITSLEITEVIIERIEKINPIINAYCTPTFDLAREMAKKADESVKKGEKLGLLQGIPVSIKDESDTKGILTTYGSKLFEKHVPKVDDVTVERLKNAGCVILGKTNLPEFGFKGVTDNLLFGTTKNPWNLERTTGGSSGGAAAAVASGLGPLALGGDGAGSIRIPSSFCGVFGIKPQYGRVPRVGMNLGTINSFFHKGPIARNVEDAALMLDILAGPHDDDRNSLPKQDINYREALKSKPNKLKIGYSMDLGYLKIIDPEVKNAILDSLPKFEELGWDVKKCRLNLKIAESVMKVLYPSGFAYLLKPFIDKGQIQIDPLLIKMAEYGLKQSVLDIKMAEMQRERVYDTVNRNFKKFDILITPSLACTAFDHKLPSPVEIDGNKLNWIENVMSIEWLFGYQFNQTGHPAASIPCGWSSEGLPIGMQIIGKRFDEATVLQVSKAFEEIAPWQDKKPIF